MFFLVLVTRARHKNSCVKKKKELFPYICAGEKGLHRAVFAESGVRGDVPEEGFQGSRVQLPLP